MSIKSIFKVIKGLFKGEIPGYIKIKLSDEKLKEQLDKLENKIWDEISQTDLRYVAKAMLNRVYFTLNKGKFFNVDDYLEDLQDYADKVKMLHEAWNKLISDIKKLEAA